ncbi:MAG: hypothetical protein HQL69_08055 [Magnetococcales bacterium]|nr:hypothetical protein [Magnetococcales bacterium]
MLDVFNLVNHPLVPWVSVGLILIWGLVSWISFKVKLNSVYQMLDEVTKNVDTHLNTSYTESSFQNLDNTLSATDGIKTPWAEFRKTFIHGEGGLQASRSPATFFTFESLVLPRVDFRYYQTVPGYLIGGGVVLTMLVFVAAIYFVYSGLSSPDLNIVKSSINGLLGTAVVKFSASIAGLFAGILFSVGEKVNNSRLEEKIVNLCQLLTEHIELVSDEQKLLNRLDEIGVEEEAKATTLRSLVADSELARQTAAHLNQAVSSLDDKIEALSKKSLEPIVETVREEVAKQGSEHELMVKELLKEVANLLSNKDLFSSIVEDVKTEIEKLVESDQNQLLEMDSSKKSEHLELILSALRQEADRLELRLGELSQQVDVKNEDSSELLTSLEQTLVKSQSDNKENSHLESVLETIRSEMSKISETLESSTTREPTPVTAPAVPAVVPVVEPLDTDKIIQPLQEAINQAAQDIVAKPLREAISDAAQEIIVQPLQEAISDASQDIKSSISLDPVIQAIKTESSILTSGQLEVLDTISQESDTIAGHVDKAVIDILQEIPKLVELEDAKEESEQLETVEKVEAVPAVEPAIIVDEELIKSVVLAVKAQEETLLVEQDVVPQQVESATVESSIDSEVSVIQKVVEEEPKEKPEESSVGIPAEEVSSIIAAVEAIAEPLLPEFDLPELDSFDPVPLAPEPVVEPEIQEPTPVVAAPIAPEPEIQEPDHVVTPITAHQSAQQIAPHKATDPTVVAPPPVDVEPSVPAAPLTNSEPINKVDQQVTTQTEPTAAKLAVEDNEDSQDSAVDSKSEIDVSPEVEDKSMAKTSDKASYRELDQYSPLSLLQDPPSIIEESGVTEIEPPKKLLADDQLAKIDEFLEKGLEEEVIPQIEQPAPRIEQPPLKKAIKKQPQFEAAKTAQHKIRHKKIGIDFDKDVKEWTKSTFGGGKKPENVGIEMVGVDLDTFAGQNRERYYFGLLTNIASQLSVRAHVKTRSLENTLNDLVRHVRRGGAISDPIGVSGLVKLGEQIEKLDFSIINSEIIESLDEAFMGLANFLRGYIRDISAVDPIETPPPSSAPVVTPSQSQSTTGTSPVELEKLMESFIKQQQRGRKTASNLAVPLVASKIDSGSSSEVALNLEKLLGKMEKQNAKKKRVKVTEVAVVENASEKPLEAATDKEPAKLEQTAEDVVPDMVKLMAKFSSKEQKQVKPKPAEVLPPDNSKKDEVAEVSAEEMDKLLKTFEKEEEREDIEHSDRKHLKDPPFTD